MMKGHVAIKQFTAAGTFKADDFGEGSKMLGWQAINTGGATVLLFDGALSLAPGQSTPLFFMQTPYYDCGVYNFRFDTAGARSLLVVGTFADK